MPHILRVLAVRYFYHVSQRQQSEKIMAMCTSWNVDKRTLLPARNILLAASLLGVSIFTLCQPHSYICFCHCVGAASAFETRQG